MQWKKFSVFQKCFGSLIVCVLLLFAIPALAAIETGDVIQFGKYSWRVLEIQNGKALILSDIIIDKKAYNYTTTTWENCELRQYLNEEFYNSFSAEEKERIAETRLMNNDNQWYGTSGGIATNDRIFLLSLEEVVKYFGDSGDLKNRKGWGWGWENENYVLKEGKNEAINDQYNSARIARDAGGEASMWWLRSPGEDNYSVTFVYDEGYVSVNGNYVRNKDGIRPALWLNL